MTRCRVRRRWCSKAACRSICRVLIALSSQLGQVLNELHLEFAADLDPALTTVHIKATAIGRQAAQFIVDRAEGRAVEHRVIDIGFSIVERGST